MTGVDFAWKHDYFRPHNAINTCILTDGFMVTCRAGKRSICCKKRGRTAAFWSAKVGVNRATLCSPSDVKTKSSTSWSTVRWASRFTLRWLVLVRSARRNHHSPLQLRCYLFWFKVKYRGQGVSSCCRSIASFIIAFVSDLHSNSIESRFPGHLILYAQLSLLQFGFGKCCVSVLYLIWHNQAIQIE